MKRPNEVTRAAHESTIVLDNGLDFKSYSMLFTQSSLKLYSSSFEALLKGFVKRLKGVCNAFERRLRTFCKEFEKSLPKGL